MRVTHFACRPPTLFALRIVSYGFQRCMLSLMNCVQSAGEGAGVVVALAFETLSGVCAAGADVLVAASISHSGAIAAAGSQC